MPREVFAEEIEQFLGTLDGVASARVFTTPAGEIAQVYVTAESTADTRMVRRSVVTALVSSYGLPVEPWRIQVTQFREGLRPSEIPRFRVARVQESLSATEVTAVVQINWVRAGEEKSATGRARGPSGSAHRLQVLAAATVEAVRDALEPAHRRVSVQQATLVTFLDRSVVLVGVSIATPRGPESSIGAAWQEEMPEAVVAAALDAVTKWLIRAAFAAETLQPGDRRERLEVMHNFVRAAERGGVGLFPGGGPGDIPAEDGLAPGPSHARGLHETAVEARTVPGGGGLDTAPDVETAPRVQWEEGASETHGPGPAAAATEEMPEDPDVLTDLSQIRPEQKGGTAMSVHHEPSRGGVVPSRPGRPSMEDTFYQSLVEGRTPVHVRCRDGYELPYAVVKDVGTYVILLETAAGTELVFKHAIISIHLVPPQAPKA